VNPPPLLTPHAPAGRSADERTMTTTACFLSRRRVRHPDRSSTGIKGDA